VAMLVRATVVVIVTVVMPRMVVIGVGLRL